MNRQAGTPERAVTLAYNVLRTVKTNKSRKRKYPKVSFVIPCLKIQVERLLWSRFFSHSKNHGRPLQRMRGMCEVGEGTIPVFCVSKSVHGITSAERPRRDEPQLG